MESSGNHTAGIMSLDALSIGLLDSAAEGFSGSLFYAAAVTVLVYDALLTLDEEWICLWRSKWSVIKCIFLVVRYVSLALLFVQTIANYATTPSDSVCSVLKWAEGVGGIVLDATVDICLLYRVYAFCGRNKYLLVGLILLYIGTQTASFSLFGILAPDYIDITNPLVPVRPLLGNCIPLRYPFKITSVWIIILCFQSILFACLLFQVAYRHFGTWNQGMSFSPLYVVFVRDGIWAYFLIVVSLILCVVSAYKAQQFGGSFIMWLYTVTSVCCCRLILNLRSVAYETFTTEIYQEDSGMLFTAGKPTNSLIESTSSSSIEMSVV